jgi:hypothetical protein
MVKQRISSDGHDARSQPGDNETCIRQTNSFRIARRKRGVAGVKEVRSAVVGLTAVIVAVTDEVPRVLVARRISHDLATPAQRGHAAERDSPDTLPFGPFDADRHRTLETGLRAWVADQTGLDLRYVEQLYTFGDRFRDPRELHGGPRILSIAYLALTRQSPVAGSGDPRWQGWYSFLPWEDWREGKPPLIEQAIRPRLQDWIEQEQDLVEKGRREDRVGICFGFGLARWDPVRVLERYELLYEAGLVMEAWRDHAERRRAGGFGCAETEAQGVPTTLLGSPMALDNRRILATALGRLRGKLAYRPVVFDLLPGEFTLFRLQRVVEALAGVRLHKQNFRRMLAANALVEATGRVEHAQRGRPAELYRFRRDVLRAKLTAGVALPTIRATV